MADKTLTTAIDVTLSATYRRVDKLIDPAGIAESLRYIDLKDSLANGKGTDRAEQMYHSRRNLNNAVEILDLDNGLQDVFGDTLNFDAVKCLIIKNRTETLGAFLKVVFKNEQYYIGPNGYRIVWEPVAPGIESIASSASFSEGSITFSSDVSLTYDLIIIGSSGENSSSSSGGRGGLG